eukprot:g24950.t1
MLNPSVRRLVLGPAWDTSHPEWEVSPIGVLKKREQEQQQSPRSPVTACATHEEEGSYKMELLELPQAIDEELDEDEVPAASSPEASEAVAVCLFDPEVVSEQRLQELCDEDWGRKMQRFGC